jgi:putative membrane protein
MKSGAQRLGVAIVMATLLTSACGDRDGDTTDTLAVAGDTAAARIDSAAGAVATGTEATPAELMSLVGFVNRAEVQMSEMAVNKIQNADVKAFARQAITEHRQLNTDLGSMAMDSTAMRNDEDLPDTFRDAMNDLNGKAAGKEFDEAYLEHTIEMHKKILDEINDALGRTNVDATLRTNLEKARTAMQAHLAKAEDLEKRFGV